MSSGRAPKTPGASQPLKKSQQTISSFFTPKLAQSQSSAASRPAPAAPADTGLPTPSTTRTEQSAGSEEDGEDDVVRKRRRTGTTGEGSADAAADDLNHSVKRRRTDSPTEHVSAQQSRNGLKETVADRTKRYVFNLDGLTPQEPEEQDVEFQAVKKKLHERFVKKLENPDRLAEIRRRNGFIDDPAAEEEEVEEGEDEEDEPAPKPTARGKKGAPGHKLTPLEQQVIDIRKKHRDAVLVVEVGYKYRFFGEDARVAAKELHIVCIPGKMKVDAHFAPGEERFAGASFPTHRLHVHVKRLVDAGYKVGIVRQVETAALKAVGNNRGGPFVRKLTNLYTKGTYVDQNEGPDDSPNGAAPVNAGAGYLLCLTEVNAKGWGTDEKVQVGMVAVQPGTGDIIYDEFEDGFMRAEIETRLLHIAPCEFLIVGELSKSTERLVKHLSNSKTNVFGDQARVERVEKSKTAAAKSFGHISDFYSNKVRSAGGDTDSAQDRILDKVHRLSEQTSICLSAMITHLTEYGLEHVFDLTKNFQSFSARSHMLLNGNTLNSLEIYRNQTDNTENGSLFWVLDQTLTRSGQRLLRKWVGRPLLDKEKLQERIDAVEELNSAEKSIQVEKLRNLLVKTKGDLEKSLIRIYYGKCGRPELLSSLQALQRTAAEYAHVKSAAQSGFSSVLLSEAIASLPLILEEVLKYLDRINAEAAKADDKEAFFLDEHTTEDIANHKAGIALIDEDLDSHRADIAAKLKKKTVEYVTKAAVDFQIEVSNKDLSRVPASWIKIGGTKQLSRFHTPDVVKMIRERDQHRESLAAACDSAFKALLAEISSNYQSFRDCIQSLSVLDCLMSLASVAARPGYCKPEFTDSTEITVEAGRHPMVEQLLLSSYVANDVALSAEKTRALLITGPNMGGKSSYVRQVALISIMGQIGSYLPAASARLGMLDAVFTRMGAFDNMLAGESTFMVELNETAEMLKQATPRSLVILDELGRGTSTHDGVAIAHAVLEHVVHETRALLLFITHYQSLSGAASSSGGALQNAHMRFTETLGPNGEIDAEVTFLYELAEGTAHRSYGLNVARLANVPPDVLEVARVRSSDMEMAGRAARLRGAAKALAGIADGSVSEIDLDALVTAVEQL